MCVMVTMQNLASQGELVSSACRLLMHCLLKGQRVCVCVCVCDASMCLLSVELICTQLPSADHFVQQTLKPKYSHCY